VADLARQHKETTPSTLKAVVGEIDPLVDRVIRRCLEKDPDQRPASALQVAAALPGGDPLAAALAAGETPSPEMVAASGGVGAVSSNVGLALLGTVVVGLALAFWLNARTHAIHYLPMSRSPEILADAARGTVERLGYREPYRDTASGFTITDYLHHLIETDPSPGRWEQLRHGQPPAVTFWYRRSPTPLLSDSVFLSGRVTSNDPPRTVAGMVDVMLDLKGRLHSLAATPMYGRPSGTPAPYDWSLLLREAGFDPSALKAAEPVWTPPVYADTRVAWKGVYPDRPDIPVHLEGAALGGRPVFFQIFEPWSETTIGAPPTPPGISVGAIVGLAIGALVIVGAILRARRNVRTDRADHAGAMRVAIVLLVADVLWGLSLAHHVVAPFPMVLTLAVVLAGATLLGSLAYVVYLALEPDVRRKSPRTLVSWSRVIAGGFRDPLVGRDLLIGAAVGVGIELLRQLQALSPSWIGRAPDLARPPIFFDGSVLRMLAYILGESSQAALVATILLLTFVLLMVVLRRKALAAACFVVLLFAIVGAQTTHWIQWPFSVLLVAVVVVTVSRLGLLPLVVAEIVQNALFETPLVLDPSSWLAPASYTVLIFVLALAVFGLRTSLAGQRVFAGRFD
jgi:hypothetical protein